MNRNISIVQNVYINNLSDERSKRYCSKL